MPPRTSPRHAAPSPPSAAKKRKEADAAPRSAAKRPQRQTGTPGTITSLFAASRAKDLVVEEEKMPTTPNAIPVGDLEPGTSAASPAVTTSFSSPAALIGTANGATPAATVTDEEEAALRGFDLAQKFGPCIGLTRLQRWRRADRFGLKPPQEALSVLMRLADDDPATMSIFSRRRI